MCNLSDGIEERAELREIIMENALHILQHLGRFWSHKATRMLRQI